MLQFFGFVLIWILLTLPELLSVYFIMPIGNSQELDAAYLSYFFYNYIWLFRISLGALFLFFSRKYWIAHKKKIVKIGIVFLLLIYLGIAYLTTFVMRADKMFYQPKQKQLVTLETNVVDLERLIIGVCINNEARAYPIQLIGYHHQIVDTINNIPLIITYCTVCRTGRVFSSSVNGVNETFRLVGMSNYNAMFEDQKTGSWWQQETGVAVFGPLKGAQLKEIPSKQVTLKNWLAQYPNSLILQADPFFEQEYASLDNYENGNKKGLLTRLDTASWQKKSWVVGVQIDTAERAYDWNALKQEQLIHDELNNKFLLLVLGKDGKSFHVWNRKVGTAPLQFFWNDSTALLVDKETQSNWNEQGTCIGGQLLGSQLEQVQAYQEYWHSWQVFHPKTTRYPR